MAIEEYIRLAWQAQNEGRCRLREAMLTLAIGASRPADAWAERCRGRLLAERHDHFLAAHPTVEQALADPRVGRALDRLRSQYPLERVRWLQLQTDAASGPFTGEVERLATLLDDLIGTSAEAEVRRDSAERARGPLARAHTRIAAGRETSLAAYSGSGSSDEVTAPSPSTGDARALTDEEEPSTEALYLAVLLSIAMLLASVRTSEGRRAA